MIYVNEKASNPFMESMNESVEGEIHQGEMKINAGACPTLFSGVNQYRRQTSIFGEKVK